MKKEKKILLYFSLYILTLLAIILVGSSNVFAETYDAYLFQAQLYDNSNGSLSTVTTNFSNNYWTGTIPYMSANTSGAAWGISSPIPLIANHTYAITVFISHEYGNTVLSTYNRIGVGSSFNEAKTSYQNNSNCNEVLSKTQLLVYGQGLQFAFTPTVNANYIVFPFATSLSGANVKFDLNNISIDDLGTSGISETTINNSLNSQTNSINNSITNSQNAITNNSNNNRDLIIQNQNDNNDALIQNDNANTDKIIADNKKNFQTCSSENLFNEDYYNNSNLYSTNIYKYVKTDIKGNIPLYVKAKLKNNGNAISGLYVALSTTPNPNSGSYKMFITNGEASYNVSIKNYNTNDKLYFTYYPANTSINDIFNNYEFWVSSDDINYIKYQEVCENKLDEANKTSKGILGKLGDLLDYFNPTSENWFVKKLVNLLIDGLKSLFVPSQEELNSLIDNFKATMETKLGAIYQVADLLVSVVQSVLSPASSNSCITFPEVKDPMFNKILINQTEYCFDSLRTDFSFLFTLSDMIISIVITLSFGNMLYKKYEAFIGGNSSDY